MYGLCREDWQSLVLSVKVHRKSRRLSPLQAAELMREALLSTDEKSLAGSLQFRGTTMLRRILRLSELPSDVAALVDWGRRQGGVSMSTASELMRLGNPKDISVAFRAAATHGLTRSEASEVVQISRRSELSVEQALSRALATRLVVQRSELVLGSLLGTNAMNSARALGNEQATRLLRRELAAVYPAVTCASVRVNGNRFSILLSEQDAAALRCAIGTSSIEEAVSKLMGTLSD
jgi:hypothetical protein